MAYDTDKSQDWRGQNAIELLEADHRQLEQWFTQFSRGRSVNKKAELTRRIIQALKDHIAVEEEIFYPAFLEATGCENVWREARRGHDCVRNLIAQIEKADSKDGHHDVRVKTLGLIMTHYVGDEEATGGMFAEATRLGMDLDALGERIAARKKALRASLRSARAARRTRVARPAGEVRRLRPVRLSYGLSRGGADAPAPSG